MGLNASQKKAVEYLDGPLLVLAGPGTGKTQLLSEKVAYILKNTDTSPENILCLTFTETGASNMRERLKSIIGKDGAKVNIGTYHAFGTEILGQYKNYAEDYDRKLDAAIDEVTQFKIIRNIQDGLSGKDILRGDNIADIISVISAAKSAGLTAEDLAKIAEQNIEDSKILSEAISPLLQNVVPRVFEASFQNAYRPIYEILSKYIDDNFVILKGIERIIVLLAKDLKEAMTEAESLQKIKPLSNWKDKYFEKSEYGEYRLKDRVANKKLLSLARIMSDYDEYLRKNGLYDFDDMIQEASRVLKNDTGFKLTLQEKYQFIMLDEFQDTNPSQFEIIKNLTDYEKPMIMAVGDDDQAIYEFQGALSTNLTDFQEYYNANVIPLTENYRSTQEILDFSRKIINQATDRFADKELTAHKPDPKDTEIFRYEFLSSDMEYGFVAEKIAELIKSGVRQNEIAVISYKTKYFMPLLPFLKAKPDINIAYEKKDNLLEDEKIRQILTMARFIFELSNAQRISSSIMEILAYPFFGLSILEVIKLVGKAKVDKKPILEYLMNSEDEKIKTVINFFANLVTKSLTEPLEIFLDYLIGVKELDGYRSPFLDYYTRNDEYAAFYLYESIAALRGKLKKHFGDKVLKLDDLIEMVNDYEMANMPINKTSPYKDADDAVQILTAHKAKGLEFEYVFIISADHVAWGKGKGNNNLLSLPKNLVQIRHTGTTDGEKLRILYVALTRAKQSLYITNALHDFNEKSPARLEYFEEYVDGDEVISPFLPSKKVICQYEKSAYEIAENNLKKWLTPYLATTPDMKAIYKERVSNYRMSATGLTSFIDIVYAGPEEFFKRQILRVPDEPETKSLAFGNLIHKTFEAVTNRGINDDEAISYFVSELGKRNLASDILRELREKGPEDLSVALTRFGNILRRGKAEVDLGAEKIAIEGVPVTGKIDHMTIDDNTKKIEIYDFKTGNYHKEKWSSHATLFKYMLQLEFYRLLLNNSLIYAKYKVARAHILFVTPDNDGEVHDKIYEFDDDVRKDLTNLLKIVYSKIVSLDFLGDPEIFRSKNEKLGLKDIKDFIKLLLAKDDKK